MNLVKIGKRTINFDHVAEVDDTDSGMTIYYANKGTGASLLNLEGEEADALRQWLASNATDVMKPASGGAQAVDL